MKALHGSCETIRQSTTRVLQERSFLCSSLWFSHSTIETTEISFFSKFTELEVLFPAQISTWSKPKSLQPPSLPSTSAYSHRGSSRSRDPRNLWLEAGCWPVVAKTHKTKIIDIFFENNIPTTVLTTLRTWPIWTLNSFKS